MTLGPLRCQLDTTRAHILSAQKVTHLLQTDFFFIYKCLSSISEFCLPFILVHMYIRKAWVVEYHFRVHKIRYIFE